MVLEWFVNLRKLSARKAFFWMSCNFEDSFRRDSLRESSSWLLERSTESELLFEYLKSIENYVFSPIYVIYFWFLFLLHTVKSPNPFYNDNFEADRSDTRRKGTSLSEGVGVEGGARSHDCTWLAGACLICKWTHRKYWSNAHRASRHATQEWC